MKYGCLAPVVEMMNISALTLKRAVLIAGNV